MSDSEPRGDLGCVGVGSFLEPDGFGKRASEKLESKRVSFYRKLADLFPEGRVYYPGSGADPVPLQAFGDRVVYGSLTESNYFRMIKDKGFEKPSAYKALIEQTSNIDQLRAVYADVRNSPFPNKTFRLIIINDLPLIFNDELVQEVNRLLEDGGVLVYEDAGDVKITTQNAESFVKEGFMPHGLDKAGGLSNVTYWGYTSRVAMRSEGKQCMNGLSRGQFLEELHQGRPTKMRGHLFRVFEKPVKQN